MYDLGGGTLDIAIAENGGGAIDIHGQGGIAMCGGRDFDRAIVDSVVKPWLFKNFDLPEDLSVNPEYKSLVRWAGWAAERTKIELSSNEETIISLDESSVRLKDGSGRDIYLDVPLSRDTLDGLIEDRVDEGIEAAREAIGNANLAPHDIARIVFIGGPTNYGPLRDKVSSELGIKASVEVNPMTAVAEGAAVFAESVDWKSKGRGRKSSRGKLASLGSIDLTLNYTKRTPDVKSRVVVQLGGKVAAGFELQIDSAETGWTSGRIPLKDGAIVEIPLSKPGENAFKVFAFAADGSVLALEQSRIVIVKTVATVDAIPASSSIGVAVLKQVGEKALALRHFVKKGDLLPKKGSQKLKSAESLKAGSSKSLNFKLYEGESDKPEDNREIGVLKIAGKDFEDGVIPAGADLLCECEMLDSGAIHFEVGVPAIGASFQARNLYSRLEAQLDYGRDSGRVADEGNRTMSRLEKIESESISDPRLDRAREKLEKSVDMDPDAPSDTEMVQEAEEDVREARRLIAQVEKENWKVIRIVELEGLKRFFNEKLRDSAKKIERDEFDRLARSTRRAIEKEDREAEGLIDRIKRNNFDILWRQDPFIRTYLVIEILG